MKKEIKKQRAIDLLRKGKNIDYIMGRYPDLGEYTVRALKAHLTMGTYDNSRESGKLSIEKNTLVELLEFGIPKEMILAKCKGIKASSIHAYKAHITRGTYKK